MATKKDPKGAGQKEHRAVQRSPQPGPKQERHRRDRLLEEHEQQVEAIRNALIEGENSGVAGPLNMAKIKRHAREEAGLTPS